MLFASSREEAKNQRDHILIELYHNKDETGDVTFIVESKRIRAHRCVLASISPKYKAQFYGPQPDKDDIIVKDISADEFDTFLQYFYVGDVALTAENIDSILSFSKQTLVDGFERECVSFLTKQIKRKENLWQYYQLITLYDIEEVKDLVHCYIAANIKEMFKQCDDFFNYCDRAMLKEILKMDCLNCKESDLFDACIVWAKAECRLKNVDAEKIENLRAELGDAVEEIRFRSMTLEEFVQLNSLYDGFFTPDEMKEITYIIGSLKNFKPSKFSVALRNEESQLSRMSISFEEASSIAVKGMSQYLYIRYLIRMVVFKMCPHFITTLLL
ncbi:BTB/POZ domain-containing protein 3-like isoform X2 [Contarinia nasturtii]|uniref:BTB/POZ domain-containing protein 3-like isoform X2 n=1 Tax=Contarinia nasturtii TaxID=265458 RepID=UPI0012D3F327|nr:BTB/POZ domain-containing protein 3-like isoform X2 [Contarinia nasturtii]